MDEFENDALSLILMLDDNLFPQFLEWAGSQGWADLVIFLLETDFLRFRSDDAFQKDNLNVQSSLISRLADFTMERTGVLGSFHKILSDEQIESLKRLGDSHIPLNSVFSHVCDYVWQDVISRGRAITTSSMWPSLRKFIVSDVKMSVGKVLGDLTNRKFFERFLQEDPADLSCLQCWISVRRIFNAVEKYTKIKNTTHNDLDSDTVSVVSVDTTSATDRDNGGFMKRWRSSSHAVKGANKALQTGSGTATTNANSNQVELGPREYSDPFEVFKIFLEGARSLQKQFFPSNAPTPSSTAQTYTRYKSNYSVQKGDEVNLEDLLTEFNQSVDPNAHRKSSTSLHHSPGIASYGGSRNVTQNHQCAGLSESLRMELVATLSLNGSVRTQDIEIVDQAFAFACANIFDKLLRKLEKETYQYILSIYPRFEQSIDYTLMIASIKSESCFSIMQYSTKLNFLYNRVRRESFVTWTDPSSKGKYFLVYEKSIEDYDDEEDPEEDDFYLCYNDYDHFTYFNPSGSVDGAGYGDEYGGAITTWNDRGGSFSGNLDRMISPPNPHEANRGSSMERANTFSNEMKMSTNPLRHQRSNSLGNANASTKVNFVEPVPRANSMMDNRINVVVAEPVQDIKVASTQVIVAISIELDVPGNASLSLASLASMVSDIAVWAGDPVTNNQSISSPRATGLAGSMYGSMRYQSQSNLNRIPSLDNSSNGMSSDFSGDEDDVHQLNSLELDDIMDYSSERVEGRRQNRDAKKAKKVKHATSDSIDRFELVAVDVDNLGQRLSYEGRGSRKSFPKYSKSSESRRRIALLVMALISVQDAGGADCDFGEKFSVPVEESFTFITDSQGLYNLNQLIFRMDGKENPRGRFKKRNNEKIKPTQSRGRLFTVSVCISSTTVESKSEFFKDAQEVQVLSEDKIIPVTVANVGSASHKSVATSSNPALLQRVTDDDYEEVPAAVKSSALSNRYDSFLTKNKTNVIADGNSATIIGSLGSDGEGFHHRINIGVSYMPLQSNFNMLSLLRSISIEAYDKSFHFESDPQADAGNNSSNRNSNGASYSSNNRRSSFRHLDSNLMTASSSQRSLIGLQDNNEIANHNFNITWRTGKRAVGHEAASQRECLYDIYIGSCQDIFQRLYEDYDHIYGSSAFKRSKSRILNDLAPLSGADDLYSTVKYPILKHLGICDFPLCSMVQTVSTRLLLQILLLILTDNSVILLSSSCTLLTQIQYAIPRLIWPFKINESHRMKQILNSAVLAAFVNRDSFQKARSSHVQQPIVKPPTAEIRKKSFFADRGKKLLHTLSGKNFFQSSQNMDDGVASIAQTEYSKGPAETPQRRTSKEISIEASPELLGKTNNTAPTTASFDFNDTGTFISNQQHLGSNDSGENSPFASTDYAESPPQHSGQRQKKPVDPKKNKSYIIAIDSKTFYSAKAETRQYLFDLKGKGDKGYTIFDLDSCIVLDTKSDSNIQRPKLSEENLFKSCKRSIVRELIRNVFKIIKTFNQVTTNPEFVDPIVMEATIQRSNNNIEQTFHLFWSELVLKCLPQNIIHYPSVKVISLDVRAMLIELVYQPHAFKSVEDDDYDEALIMKNGNNNMNFSNHGNENKIMNYSDSNFDDMDFDEFLAFYKEQVRTSEDILSLFYYDFFTEKSPVFNDILKRHAKIIDNWAY